MNGDSIRNYNGDYWYSLGNILDITAKVTIIIEQIEIYFDMQNKMQQI